MAWHRTATFTGHRGAVYSVQGTANPNLFLSASGDGKVVRWDMRMPDHGEQVADALKPIYTIHNDRDRKLLFIGNSEGGLHVVDGSDPDPQGQIAAVRQVLAEIGAADRAEQLVINKVDQADPDVLAVLKSQYPDAVVVSARTGQGLDRLRAVIEERLPSPQLEVTALVPWNRGDLVDRVHREGETLLLEHLADGTLVKARVHPDLAAQLAPYAPADAAQQQDAGQERD